MLLPFPCSGSCLSRRIFSASSSRFIRRRHIRDGSWCGLLPARLAFSDTSRGMCMQGIAGAALSAALLRCACLCCASFFTASFTGCDPQPDRRPVSTLQLSLGSALGSLFVGVVAPNVFRANYELSIGLVLAAILALVVMWNFGVVARLFWTAGTLALVWIGMRRRARGSMTLSFNYAAFTGRCVLRKRTGRRRLRQPAPFITEPFSMACNFLAMACACSRRLTTRRIREWG